MNPEGLGASLEHLRTLSRTRGARAYRYLSTKIRERLGNSDLFAVEDPTPPPRRPMVLPGSLWAITAVFNPTSNVLWRENYFRFRKGMEGAGVPLLAVELAYEGQPYRLGGQDADVLVQLRGGDRLWQKERLLNLGLRKLPGDCDKVAWIDSDLLFSSSTWPSETSRLLEEYVAVQPFLSRVRLSQGMTPERLLDPGPGMGEDKVHYGFAYGFAAKGPTSLRSYYRGGSTGFAWAFRREILDRHGLYDRHILGGGDRVMARAMVLGEECVSRESTSPGMCSHVREWAGPFHAGVGSSVAYVPGCVYHLWHGSLAPRGYGRREEILLNYRYDPSKDVVCASDGPLQWAGATPPSRAEVQACLEGLGPRDAVHGEGHPTAGA